MDPQLKIALRPRAIAFALLAVALLLIVAHFLVLLLVYVLGVSWLEGFFQLVNLDVEDTTSTWFTAGLLFINALLLAGIAHTSQRSGERYRWGFLAVLVGLVSIDEVAALHELVGQELQERLGTTGLLHYAWVIPAAILVFAVGITFLRFLVQQGVAGVVVLSGAALYVVGNVGTELAEGWVASELTDGVVVGHLLTGFQESLEMIAIIIVLYGLLRLFSSRTPVSLTLREDAPESTRTGSLTDGGQRQIGDRDAGFG